MNIKETTFVRVHERSASTLPGKKTPRPGEQIAA